MFDFTKKKPVSLLILGDLILDRYIEGQVKRISPEAPVPVLLQTAERDVLGGAGNVANNIRALGGEAFLVGVLGKDDAAERFKLCAQRSGTKLYAVIDDNRRTTVKTRLLGDRQQLLRVDCEDVDEVNEANEISILANVRQLVNQVNAIIISDYRKGALSSWVLKETIALAKKYKVTVFVDPKGHEYAHYTGADYIKPNLRELELLTKMSCENISKISEAATFLSENTKSSILVTLSQDGMILFKRDGSKFSLPTEAKEVFDVSGAGDTAIASFAFATSHGENAENSAIFANIASGIAVSKIGTAAVTSQEILAVTANIFPRTNNNYCDHTDLKSAILIREEWKKNDLKVGFTNGCFDLLHPGHIALLQGAAAECDRLIVGLNSDCSVQKLKGVQRPIQNELSRAEVLRAIECVDLVVIFDEDTPLETIKAIKPDVLIKGKDYEEHEIIGAKFVKDMGGRIVRVQLRQGHSTTNLVKRSNVR